MPLVCDIRVNISFLCNAHPKQSKVLGMNSQHLFTKHQCTMIFSMNKKERPNFFPPGGLDFVEIINNNKKDK